jgi:hypothetical protein
MLSACARAHSPAVLLVTQAPAAPPLTCTAAAVSNVVHDYLICACDVSALVTSCSVPRPSPARVSVAGRKQVQVSGANLQHSAGRGGAAGVRNYTVNRLLHNALLSSSRARKQACLSPCPDGCSASACMHCAHTCQAHGYLQTPETSELGRSSSNPSAVPSTKTVELAASRAGCFACYSRRETKLG